MEIDDETADELNRTLEEFRNDFLSVLKSISSNLGQSEVTVEDLQQLQRRSQEFDEWRQEYTNVVIEELSGMGIGTGAK